MCLYVSLYIRYSIHSPHILPESCVFHSKFIIYSSTNQSLNVCRCPRFQNLLKACWPKAKVTGIRPIKKTMGYEYLVGATLMAIDIRMCMNYYQEPFAQLSHDGGTMKNHKKHQSASIKYITPFKLEMVNSILEQAAKRHAQSNSTKLSVEQLFNLPGVQKKIYELRTVGAALEFRPENVAIMFSLQKASGDAKTVGAMLTKGFNDVTKINITDAIRSVISDAAALTVSKHLGTLAEADADGGGGGSGGDGGGDDDGEDENDDEEDDDDENDEIHEIQVAVEILELAPTLAEAKEEESDTAALTEIRSRLCDMHNLSKVIQWAFGMLLKSKNKQPFEPFDIGKAVVLIANAIAKHFNYGRRRELLKEWAEKIGAPTTHPHVNVNGTRVLAAARVLNHVVEKGESINPCSWTHIYFVWCVMSYTLRGNHAFCMGRNTLTVFFSLLSTRHCKSM